MLNRDRLLNREQGDSWGKGRRVEQKRKRTHGHRQWCGDCGVDVVGGGREYKGNKR